MILTQADVLRLTSDWTGGANRRRRIVQATPALIDAGGGRQADGG